MTSHSKDLELKDGSVDEFKYLEGTNHCNDVDGLVYETARVVEETNPRRGTFIVAYRRLVYTNGARGSEDKDSIYLRDIKKMTACTDEENLDMYGVAPEADFFPDEHKNLSGPHATGSVHRSVSSMYPEYYGEVFDKRSTMTVKLVIGEDVDVAMDGFPVERWSAQLDITDRSESSADDGTKGRPRAVERGPITGYKRLRAAERLEAMDADLQATKRNDGSSSGGAGTRKI